MYGTTFPDKIKASGKKSAYIGEKRKLHAFSNIHYVQRRNCYDLTFKKKSESTFVAIMVNVI
jgi:hypothetical protein